jgi:hypothetical protein
LELEFSNEDDCKEQFEPVVDTENMPLNFSQSPVNVTTYVSSVNVVTTGSSLSLQEEENIAKKIVDRNDNIHLFIYFILFGLWSVK